MCLWFRSTSPFKDHGTNVVFHHKKTSWGALCSARFHPLIFRLTLGQHGFFTCCQCTEKWSVPTLRWQEKCLPKPKSSVLSNTIIWMVFLLLSQVLFMNCTGPWTDDNFVFVRKYESNAWGPKCFLAWARTIRSLVWNSAAPVLQLLEPLCIEGR